MFRQFDLSDSSSIEKFGRDMRNELGELGILVHCGGAYARGEFSDTSMDQLRNQFETNVLGVHALTLELLPLLERARGDIVFINSSVVYSDGKSVSSFAAAQHALHSLANSLRAEVNAKGIRVLSVFPGRTATPRQERIFSAEGRSYDPERLLQPEDIAHVVATCLELGETAEVTDIRIRPRFA